MGYSVSYGDRESLPFHEDWSQRRDIHLYFNQRHSSAPVLFCVMHSALPARPQPLVTTLQIVEVWPYSEERKLCWV